MKKAIDKYGNSYADIIGKLQGIKIPLDVQRYWSKIAKIVTLRHDVDRSIDQAIKFGEVEADCGLRGTYFLLHTAPYFDYSKEFEEKIQQLCDMGHTIGFHNNVIAAYLQSKDTVFFPKIIIEPLKFLRGICPVVGTASHGDQICKTEGKEFTNYELWQECRDSWRKGNVPPEVPRYPLDTFQFVYEAYFVQRDAYLSDSGGNWAGGIGSEVAPFEEPGDDDKIISTTTERWNQLEGGAVMQVLAHPCWWEIK